MITGTTQSYVNEIEKLIESGICTACKLEDADPSTIGGQYCKPCFDTPKMIWH